MIGKLINGIKRNSCILLLLASIISGCKNNLEEEKVYYDNGSLKYSVPLLNGKREGLLQYYYPNGRLMLESNWKNGKRNGKIVSYHKNGKKKEVGFCIEGLPEGLFQLYDSAGNLRQSLKMVDGKKNGVDYVYDKNGSVISETNFLNGNLHGKAITFNGNEIVSGRYIYNNDSMVYSIEYLDSNRVTNQHLSFENTADPKNEYKIGEPQDFTLKLMYSYYDDAYLGLLLGEINDSGLLVDTLDSFTSDNLTLHYQVTPKKLGTNKVTGYVYEICGDIIKNQMRIEYPLEVNDTASQ